jgi:CubicO group peptidase (beta-lactamase class C family)
MKWKQVWACVVLAFLCGGTLYPQITAKPLGDSLKTFEQQMEQLRQELKIPGMAAAIVWGKTIAWSRGFGYSNEEKGIVITPDTPFRIASLTKTFTAVVVMQLAQKGKIDLDLPVKQYGIEAKNGDRITVRHLLSHTSEYKPGSYYRYSGWRYGWLSRIIKNTTGQCFGDLVLERIIHPLNLTATAPCCPELGQNNCRYDSQQFTSIFERQTKVYRTRVGGATVPSQYRYAFNTAGGLVSTVLDMAMFAMAVDSGQLLNAASRKSMFTPFESSSGRRLPHGLGWFCQTFRGIDLHWHYGHHTDAVSTLILKIPQRAMTFIVFANSDKLSEPFSLHNGNVLNSPAALLLLEHFVATGADKAAIIKQRVKIGEIIRKSTGQTTLLSNLEQVVLLICSVMFLFTAVFWPLLFIVDIVRKRFRIYFRRRAIIIFIARFCGWVAACMGLWLMGAIRRIPALIYWHELPGYFDGIPLFQNLTLALPTILTIWAIFPTLFTIYIWKKRYMSAGGRHHYTGLTVMTLIFILFLLKWNLVGIEYYWRFFLFNL